jgi:hypothetical protein
MPVDDAAAAEHTADLCDDEGNDLSDERFYASKTDALFRFLGFLPRVSCVFEDPQFVDIMCGLSVFARIPTDVLHQFCEGIAPMVFECTYAVMKKAYGPDNTGFIRAKGVLEYR